MQTEQRQTHQWKIACPACQHEFSFLSSHGTLCCPSCKTMHEFPLQEREKLLLFEQFIAASEKAQPVLSEAKISIRVGEQEVAIPYRLLLTRFQSTVCLTVNNQSVTASFFPFLGTCFDN